MGLCKCRVVTSLFCFEHKTNVCEKCISSTHPRCIVKSYLQWLQDSDFDATCTLCRRPLTEGDVVRLTCLDLFHKNCLDQYAQGLPENTAPAGYACPQCGVAIIPPENAASLIASNVRQVFRTSAWARPILGVQDLVKGNGHGDTGSVATPVVERAPAEKQPKVSSTTAGSALASQAVSSRKAPSAAAAAAAAPSSAAASVAVPPDEDDDLHKYKQRRGYFTRLLLMTFWRPNNHGDLVLHMPRLLMFLFVLSVVVVVALVYDHDASSTLGFAVAASSKAGSVTQP